MSAALEGLLGWLDSTEAALGLFIAAVGTGLSAWFSWHQRNLARRERAADLFDRFYSLESYHAMVAPVFVIMLRWYALRGAARTAYAAALCKGWTGHDRAADLIAAYDPGHPEAAGRASVEGFAEAHFQHPRSADGITGHAALTAFLYFWVKLDAMLDARLVSRRLARQLFRTPYAIYAQFIADFRQAVLDHPGASAVPPAWVDATRDLEGFLLDEPLVPARLDWGGGAGPAGGGAPTAQ